MGAQIPCVGHYALTNRTVPLLLLGWLRRAIAPIHRTDFSVSDFRISAFPLIAPPLPLKKSRSIRTGSTQRGSCDIQLLHLSGNQVEGVVLALAVDFGLGFPMPDDDRESHGLGPGFGRFLCAICAE